MVFRRAQPAKYSFKRRGKCLLTCIPVLLLILSLQAANASECADGVNPPPGFPAFVCMNASTAAMLYTEPRSYRIIRKGKTIGKHELEVVTREVSGGVEVSVDVNSKIKVRVLKVPVFSFNYVASERWLDGKLQSVTARTTENGTSSEVAASREGSRLVLQQGTNREVAETLNHTSNHWLPEVLISNELFNTLTGKRNEVDVQMLGKTTLELPGGATPAWHFRYSDSLQAQVWYDDSGRWLQLEFKGEDKSAIIYQYEGNQL